MNVVNVSIQGLEKKITEKRISEQIRSLNKIQAPKKKNSSSQDLMKDL
jgi:hypothetical protein